MAARTLPNFDLDAYVLPRRSLIEEQLDIYLAQKEPEELWQSMRYSALSGGKRFRALLCLASAEIVNETKAAEIALACACAIEMVHAMSLIHDDLPCMDNDDFRRGKPTNHKVYGEAMALLAGDALLVLASETLLKHTADQVKKADLIDVAAELACAAGPAGMVGGQVSDAIATGLVTSSGSQAQGQSSDLLASIHRRKTGALLRFSCWSGAKLMGAEQPVLKALLEFGELLGLAFQIADDLLDTTGDLSTLGKTPGKDAATGKLTWVSIYGVDGSRKALRELEEKAKAHLIEADLPEKSLTKLFAFLNYGTQRKS